MVHENLIAEYLTGFKFIVDTPEAEN